MSIKRAALGMFTLFAGATASHHTFALDQFFTSPGTRAQSMGGAFVAVANDATSMWYNPAYLGSLGASQGFLTGGDLTLEVGDNIVGVDNPSNDFYTTETDVKYLGAITGYFGMGYFSPYDFYTGLNTGGETHTEYFELKFATGLPIGQWLGWGNRFSVGGTLDVVSQNFTCKTQGTNDCGTSGGASISSFDITETGLGFTLSALADTYVENVKLSGGFTYRSEAFLETSHNGNELPSRPQDISIGAAVGFPVSSVYLLFSGQYNNLNYGTVWYASKDNPGDQSQGIGIGGLVTNKLSFGSELTYSTTSWDFIGRLGFYTSTSDVNTTAGNPVPDVSAFTLGGGIRYAQWSFDLATEQRTIFGDTANVSTQDESESMISLSVSYSFTQD